MAQRVPLTPEQLGDTTEKLQSPENWKNYLAWKDAFRSSREQHMADGGLPEPAPEKLSLAERLDSLSFQMSAEEMVDQLVQEFEKGIVDAENFLKVLDAMLAKKLIDESEHSELLQLPSIVGKVANSARRTVGVLRTSPVVEGEVVDDALILL